MGGGGGGLFKTPKVPELPKPEPTPPLPAPVREGEREREQERTRRAKALLAMKGRESTVLTAGKALGTPALAKLGA